MPRTAKTEAPPFGKNLARLRNEVGISQEQFAHKLGIDPSAIHRLERMTDNPTLNTLKSLEKALGVTLEDLIHYNDGSRQDRLKSKLRDQFCRIRRLPKDRQKQISQELENELNAAERPSEDTQRRSLKSIRDQQSKSRSSERHAR